MFEKFTLKQELKRKIKQNEQLKKENERLKSMLTDSLHQLENVSEKIDLAEDTRLAYIEAINQAKEAMALCEIYKKELLELKSKMKKDFRDKLK